MNRELITALVLVLIFACFGYVVYEKGRDDGCYDLSYRLNHFGYNQDLGISSYAWCTLKNDQITE